MLDQSTGRFQSVKDGLPELIKNSKDQYSRLRVLDKDMRQILILISTDMTRLAVLDFGGARVEQFDQWQVWSSREASQSNLAQDIEGAHGNGGKSFMVRGSTRESYMCSVLDRRITKMGFRNDDPTLRYRPGRYRNEAGQTVYALPCPDVEAVLDSELAHFYTSIEHLPKEAKRVFRERQAFTILHVDGVLDWEGHNSRVRERLIQRLPEDLRIHSQAALTIESCSVRVFRGQTPLGTGGVLQVQEPEPYQGFENLPRIPIPSHLPDPDTNEAVKTGRGGPQEKYLEIKTSAQSLRLSDRTKAKNALRIRNERNIVANKAIAELVPMSTSGFLYGTLRVPGITDRDLIGIEREYLADTALVRALLSWASERLREVAEQIQQAQSSRESPIERERANDVLSRFRELMRQFLNPEVGSGGDVGPNPPPTEWGTNVNEIVLETEGRTLRFPLGTTVPLVFHAYEVSDGTKLPVRRPDLQLECSNPGLVTIVGHGSLAGLRQGVCQIRLVDWESHVRSNPVTVEVLNIERLQIDSPECALKQGERKKITIKAHGKDGTAFEDLVYQAGVDELEMGRIGRSGVFTAGRHAGYATIRLRFGPDERDNATCQIQISDERVERDTIDRGRGGPDIPYLMICGETAPGYEHLSEEQRTLNGGPEYPTIIDQDPVWPNIVWINPYSKESEKVRGHARTGGRRGLHTTTFQQFLAIKAFEVLRRLKVAQEIGDNQATSVEFLQYLAQAEMETADFLDAAYDLIDRMLVEAD